MDGNVFEYFGGEYYRLDSSLGPGDSFGEQIMHRVGKIVPKGYKTDNSPVELAILSKERFTNCMQRAQEGQINAKVHFLMRNAVFASLSR